MLSGFMPDRIAYLLVSGPASARPPLVTQRIYQVFQYGLP